MKLKSSNRFLFVLRNFLTAQAIVVSFFGTAHAANENRYWDGGTTNIATTGDSASAGGTGNWDVTLTNWDAGAVPHVAWVNGNNDYAIFGGTAGTVTLASAVSANKLTFNTTGYIITGNTLTLAGPAPEIATGTSISANISSILAGTTGLNKTGAGTLTLNNTTAANTFTGGTTISGGILSIGTGGTGANTARVDALGTSAVTVNSTGTLKLWIQNSTAFTLTNALTVNGGTILNQDGNHTLSGTLAVGASGATLQAVFSGKNLTMSGVVSGSGPITVAGGGGAVVLSGTNTYTGAIGVSSGTLQIASAANLGTSAVSLSFPTAGAGLNVTGTAVTLANNISLGAVTGNINLDTPNNSSTVFNGTISGGGASSVWFLRGGASGQNTGAITLNGTNTLAGTINVQRGPLILGNSSAAGTASIILDSNKNANGALQLAGNFTISNNVAINSGTTQPIGVATGLSAGISGVISSSVAGQGIDKVGAGTLTTTATNTFSGPTTVTAGTLKLDYSANDTSKLADAAALTLAGGTLNLNSASATTHLEVVGSTNVTGNSTLTRTGSSANKIALGAITNVGGSLTVGADSIATTTTALTNGLLPGFISVNGAPATKDGSDNIIAYTGFADVNRLGGTIANGPGSNVRIVEAGASGNVTLAASGTTNIGTLFNAGTIASTLVDIGSGNTLRLNDLGSIQAGTNGLTISNGTLTAGGIADTAGTVDVFNGSASATTISSAITNNGTGTVGLAKSGTGVLVLGGVNTYTGTSTVNGGTLALSGGSAIADTGTISLANNAGVALRLDSSETVGVISATGTSSSINLQANALTLGDASSFTIPSPITGTGGSLVKQGAGTLTLTGTNTYTGGTTISNGTLQTNSTGSLSGAVSVGPTGTLALNAAGSTFANALSGTGTVAVTLGATTTTTTLSGNLSGFTGTLSLSTGGKLNLSSTGANQLASGATIKLNSGATLFQSSAATSLSSAIQLYGGTTGEAIGQLRLEGGATLSGAVTLFANTTVGNNTAGNVGVISGNIGENGGSFGITKLAAGTITLSGTNTYTGATTVSAGGLNLTGSIAGSAVTLAAATTLSGEGSVASLTTSGASNLVIDPSTAGALTASGALTMGGVATVSFAGGAPPTSGTVRVLNFGSTTATAANFALANAASYRSPVFTVSATAVDLTLGNTSLTWTGTGGSNWDVNTTSNWNNPTPAASKFFFGDAVTFNDTPGANQTVGLTVAVQPSSITVNNSTYTYSISGAGAINGTTGLTKSGTNTLTLGGTNNTYTGPVTVNAGTLVMASATALGQSTGVTIASGAAIDNNGQTPGTAATGGYAFTIAGNGPAGAGAIVNNSATGVASNAGVKFLTLSGNASVGGVNRFDIGAANVAGTGTINGGGFTLTKVGANQIGMRGPASNITYVVNAGTMWFEDSDAASGTNPITVNGTALLGTFGPRTIANSVTLSAGTSLVNMGGATSTWTGAFTLGGNASINNQNFNQINVTGTISGSSLLSSLGSSTNVLTASNTGFTGKIAVDTGILRVAQDTSLGAVPGSVVADAITLTNNGRIQAGNTTAGLDLTLSSNRGITLGAAGGGFHVWSGFTLNYGGPISGSLVNSNFNKQDGGTLVYSGTATHIGSTNLVTGILTLSGATMNTTSFLSVQNGTLNVNSGTSVTTPGMRTSDASGAVSVVNQNSGTINVTGTINGNTQGDSLVLGHWNAQTTYNLSGGSLNAAGANLGLGWDSTNTVFNQSGGTVNIKGLNLGNGRNNFAAYNLTGGRLNLGTTGVTTASAKQLNLGGGILGAFADWSSSQTMSLTGTGGNVTVNTLDSVDNTTGRTITLSGTLSGTGGLTKSGAGNLMLTGTKSYTGATSVSGGTLFPGTTLTTSAITSNTGGTVQPGTVATSGTSTLGSLALNGGGAAFRANFSTGDKFVVNTVDGFTVPVASSLSVTPAGDLIVGDTLTLIDYNGTIGGLGFAGLSLAPLANPHFAASLVDDTVNTQVQVQIDAIDSVVWLGNVNGTWDLNTTSNWKTFSDDLTSKFYTYDAVKFTDDGAATPAVALVGTIQPSSVTFDATVDYTLSGAPIIGNGGFVKNNTGKVTLLNNNTYVGTTTINVGTVVVGNGTTTGTLGGTGDITIGSGATLEISRSDAQTLSRKFTGGGTLVKSGSGSLTTSTAGNNADVIVNGGTFVARGGGFSAGYLVGKTITVNAGATLDTAVHSMGSAVGGGGNPPAVVLNGGNWILNGEQYMQFLTMTAATTTRVAALDGIRTLGGSVYTINAAATSSIIDSPFNLVNNVAVVVADGAATNDLVVSGNISNSGVITKTGAGRFQITGTNTSTGGFALNGGSLEASSIADAGGVGSIGVYTTGTPGYLGIANDATFRYTGTGSQTSGRNLWIDTGAQTKTIEVTSATASITFSGTGGNINKPFKKTGPGALTIADVIQTGGAVTVDDGTLTLGGTNSYTGDSTVNAGATLVVDGDSIADTGKLLINGSGKVQVTEPVDPTVETVDTLFIDGVQQLAGTYGATGSGATNIDDTHFSGAGVVQVVTGPPTGYGSWVDTFTWPLGADKTRTGDPDGDGFTNLQEFLFGTSPVAGNGSLATTTVSGNILTIRWSQRVTGATYRLMESATLANPWTLSGATPTNDGAAAGDYQPRKADVTIGAGSNFFRVEGVEN